MSTATIAMPQIADCVLMSTCGRYRYCLGRDLGNGSGLATFVMLNPSTADASTDDQTLKKCKGFAARWGFRGLWVVNLFGLRATDPDELRFAEDPIGPENHLWLKASLEGAKLDGGPVVCAWGSRGRYLGMHGKAISLMIGLGIVPLCLGTTIGGYPLHPLRLSWKTKVRPYC